MKRIFLAILFVAISGFVIAQNTTPRFGSLPKDNTGRTLTYGYNIKGTDAAGVDTIQFTPSAYETIVTGIIKDTVNYKIRSLVNSFCGDKLTFLLTNSSGSDHKVYFIGSGFETSSGTISLTSSKYATITFMFNGVAWVELNRMVQ